MHFLTRSLLIILVFQISLSTMRGNDNNEKKLLNRDSIEVVESKPMKIEDLEIKDPNLIFSEVWKELVEEYGGEEKLRFPKEIFWLNGAPGAGKGTHTEFIMKYRGLTGAPIVVSDILQSPEAQKRKDAGLLAGDKEVTALVLRKLLESQYANGAIVDGYPRTQVQVECLKLFYTELTKIRTHLVQKKKGKTASKTNFHIIVLFVDEEESIRRQLERGRKALIHNKEVEASGMGKKFEVRPTDLDVETARRRYRTFKEQTYNSLQSLREVFHYHFINAKGTIEEVQARIIEELKYQSSLELNQDTFDRLQRIPLSSEITKHARQQLVNRLDDYEANHTQLFKKVVVLIEEKFIPIIKRHAMTGRAQINTEDTILEDPMAIVMLIDIFADRGYQATVQIKKEEIPESVDSKSFKINTRIKKVYQVMIQFPGSEIRRG